MPLWRLDEGPARNRTKRPRSTTPDHKTQVSKQSYGPDLEVQVDESRLRSSRRRWHESRFTAKYPWARADRGLVDALASPRIVRANATSKTSQAGSRADLDRKEATNETDNISTYNVSAEHVMSTSLYQVNEMRSVAGGKAHYERKQTMMTGCGSRRAKSNCGAGRTCTHKVPGLRGRARHVATTSMVGPTNRCEWCEGTKPTGRERIWNHIRKARKKAAYIEEGGAYESRQNAKRRRRGRVAR
ncbi:hypothetical protein BKA62DRAFT_761050 [Auriculariales sp. MPI-PUGE-AT-0066]|nr:hypothetical protein BKA62DRAFT_761050 [Auriculariales sp. MPI-PUGE-AT-0066]